MMVTQVRVTKQRWGVSVEGRPSRNKYSQGGRKRMQPKPMKSPRQSAPHGTGEGAERPRQRSDTAAFLIRCQAPQCAKGRKQLPKPPLNRERGGQRTRNTHQKMVPNFMLLHSSVKSSNRTLSVSWKRLSNASQSVCRPGGTPMAAERAHQTPSRRRQPRKPDLTSHPVRRDALAPRDVYPAAAAPPPALRAPALAKLPDEPDWCMMCCQLCCP